LYRSDFRTLFALGKGDSSGSPRSGSPRSKRTTVAHLKPARLHLIAVPIVQAKSSIEGTQQEQSLVWKRPRPSRLQTELSSMAGVVTAPRDVEPLAEPNHFDMFRAQWCCCGGESW
jgi:hypothetical protein